MRFGYDSIGSRGIKIHLRPHGGGISYSGQVNRAGEMWARRNTRDAKGETERKSVDYPRRWGSCHVNCRVISSQKKKKKKIKTLNADKRYYPNSNRIEYKLLFI